MKDYSIPRDVIEKLSKTPERIVWLMKLLDVANDEGELEISYQQAAVLLCVSKGTARHFLDDSALFAHTSRTLCAHFVVCKLESYLSNAHDLRTLSAQLPHTLEEVKPKKKAVRKKPIEEYSLQTRATDAFVKFVEEKFNISYAWDGKNASQLKRLLGMIKASRESKSMSVDDDGVLEGFGQFVQYVYNSQDQFHIENFTIPHLVSFYNNIQLQQQARSNGKQYSTRREQSDAALINHQKELVANSASEAQRRWLESKGKGAE